MEVLSHIFLFLIKRIIRTLVARRVRVRANRYVTRICIPLRVVGYLCALVIFLFSYYAFMEYTTLGYVLAGVNFLLAFYILFLGSEKFYFDEDCVFYKPVFKKEESFPLIQLLKCEYNADREAHLLEFKNGAQILLPIYYDGLETFFEILNKKEVPGIHVQEAYPGIKFNFKKLVDSSLPPRKWIQPTKKG